MSPPWRPAYVGVGSNLNQPMDRVREAFKRMGALPATLCVARSRLYLTKPMGPQDQPNFVNAAVGLLTTMSARELLDKLLEIEREMGRNRQQRWGPRVIDLDLIWMVGAAMDEPGLTVPHPGVSSRNFVLYPLADIAPTITISGLGNVLDLSRAVDGDGITLLE